MAKFTIEQKEALMNKDFFEDYKYILIHRLTDSNLQIEDMDIYDAIKLRDNKEAFQKLYMFFKDDKKRKLDKQIITEVGDKINQNAMYVSYGFRNIGKYLDGDKNIPISEPANITSDLDKLLFDYYETWKDKDIFEREALFNIEFLRIHPFEDGNGRTSRLLLCFNLINQGYVPIIIPPIVREEYFEARDRLDTEWIKNKFKELSDKESEVLDKLIEQYYVDNPKKTK